MTKQRTTSIAIVARTAIVLTAVCLSRLTEAADGSLRGTPLPNWEAPWEKDAPVDHRTDSFYKGDEWGIDAKAARSRPPSDVRLPAEYEPTDAVVMSWKGYPWILEQLAIEITKAGTQVLMVNGPASLGGVPNDQYTVLPLSANSVWTRDFGPIGVLLNNGTEPAIVDTRYRHFQKRVDDDNVPCSVAQKQDISCYSTDLILDGGNLMSDGKGNIFMTTRTYDWNDHLPRNQVDDLLKSYFGADHIHALDYAKDSRGEPADGTGHIDMFAKILDECIVLVSWTMDLPYSQPLNAMADYFASIECAPGQKYSVHRAPSWSDGETWYTYTNSLVVNDVVIVPSYRKGVNSVAIGAYKRAHPGLKVVTVNTDASIGNGGSVHCLTRQLPRAG